MGEEKQNALYMIEEARLYIEGLCKCAHSETTIDCPACQAISLLYDAVDNLNK